MNKPVCIKCQREFKCEDMGIPVLEYTDFGVYRIWNADIWQCPECGHQITHGYGNRPTAEHFEDNFQRELKIALSNPKHIKSFHRANLKEKFVEEVLKEQG